MITLRHEGSDESIEKLIARARRRARLSLFKLPLAGWMAGALFCYWVASVNDYGITALIASIIWIVSLYATLMAARHWRRLDKNEHRLTWKSLESRRARANIADGSTRMLANRVQKIYDADPAGEMFLLQQAIRLIDIHERQKRRARAVKLRLDELHQIQKSLTQKLARLRELGEQTARGEADLDQLAQHRQGLREVQEQIENSCRRLSAIVASAEKATQVRQLHREVENLSARLPRQTEAPEPAFEAESLEDIERQIGREIETYLQLERETEERLR